MYNIFYYAIYKLILYAFVYGVCVHLCISLVTIFHISFPCSTSTGCANVGILPCLTPTSSTSSTSTAYHIIYNIYAATCTCRKV